VSDAAAYAPEVGAVIERDLVLDEAAIRAGALAVGDLNPLHHDSAFAAASRYGALIASGAHMAGLLAGMISAGFGFAGEARHGHVGVDYQVRFRRPVRVGCPLRLRWVVARLEPRRSGTLVHMEGGVFETGAAAPALEARIGILYFAAAAPDGGSVDRTVGQP
jgi:acyl dehydratase